MRSVFYIYSCIGHSVNISIHVLFLILKEMVKSIYTSRRLYGWINHQLIDNFRKTVFSTKYFEFFAWKYLRNYCKKTNYDSKWHQAWQDHLLISRRILLSDWWRLVGSLDTGLWLVGQYDKTICICRGSAAPGERHVPIRNITSKALSLSSPNTLTFQGHSRQKVKPRPGLQREQRGGHQQEPLRLPGLQQVRPACTGGSQHDRHRHWHHGRAEDQWQGVRGGVQFIFQCYVAGAETPHTGNIPGRVELLRVRWGEIILSKSFSILQRRQLLTLSFPST